MATSKARLPRTLREVVTCRRRKSRASPRAGMTIPLWLGAKAQPRYSPKSPAAPGGTPPPAAATAPGTRPRGRRRRAPPTGRPRSVAAQLPAVQRPGAGHVEVGSLEQKHGKEERGLVAGQEPGHPGLARGLLRGPREHPGVDVRIDAHLVGVTVMPVVLVHPVGVADPGPQIGAGQTDQAGDPARAEELAMADLMTEETDLGQHDGQVGGDDQLVPGVADPEQGRPAGGQPGADQSALGQRVPWCAPEQARGAHLAGKIHEIALAPPARVSSWAPPSGEVRAPRQVAAGSAPTPNPTDYVDTGLDVSTGSGRHRGAAAPECVSGTSGTMCHTPSSRQAGRSPW